MKITILVGISGGAAAASLWALWLRGVLQGQEALPMFVLAMAWTMLLALGAK